MSELTTKETILSRLPKPRWYSELLEEDGKHFYLVKDDIDGKTRLKLPGTTGFLRWIGGDKTNALCGWYAAQVGGSWHDHLLDIAEHDSGRNIDLLGLADALLMECRGAAIRAFKGAGHKGSNLHELWEKIVLGKELGEIPKHLALQVHSFKTWWETANLKVLATELAMADPEIGYGGSADLIAVDKTTGEICILDYKSSAGRHNEMAIQLAAYKNLLYSQYGVCASKLAIVRVPEAIEYGEELPVCEVSWVKDAGACFELFLNAMHLAEGYAEDPFFIEA